MGRPLPSEPLSEAVAHDTHPVVSSNGNSSRNLRLEDASWSLSSLSNDDVLDSARSSTSRNDLDRYSTSSTAPSSASTSTSASNYTSHLLYDGPLLAPLRLSASTTSTLNAVNQRRSRSAQRQNHSSLTSSSLPPSAAATGSLPLSYYFTRLDRPPTSSGREHSATQSPSHNPETSNPGSRQVDSSPSSTPSSIVLSSSSPLDQLRQSVHRARAEVDSLPSGSEMVRVATGASDATAGGAMLGSDSRVGNTGSTARSDMERVLRGARTALRNAVGFAERLEQVSANLPALRASLLSNDSSSSTPSPSSPPYDLRPPRRRRLHSSEEAELPSSSLVAASYSEQPRQSLSTSITTDAIGRPFPGPEAALSRSLERSIATLRTAAARIDRLLEEFSSTVAGVAADHRDTELSPLLSDRGRTENDGETRSMERSVEERRQAWYARYRRGVTQIRASHSASQGPGRETGVGARAGSATPRASRSPVRRQATDGGGGHVHDPNGVETETSLGDTDAMSALASARISSNTPLDGLLRTTEHAPVLNSLSTRTLRPGQQRSLEALSFPIKLDWNGVEIREDEDDECDGDSDGSVYDGESVGALMRGRTGRRGWLGPATGDDPMLAAQKREVRTRGVVCGR